MKHILIVDDSKETQMAISGVLGFTEYSCIGANSCQEALQVKRAEHFDLLIFDIGLPDGDGLSLMNDFLNETEYRNTPALVLSANDNVTAKVSAFSLGAEDYVTKPFNLLEMRARIESKLRVSNTELEESDVLLAEPFRLEISKQKAIIDSTGLGFSLTATEFRILSLLLKRRGSVFTRAQIIDLVWGFNRNVTERTVDSHIYMLRKKLGAYGSYIESIACEGYRIRDFRK